MVGVRVRDFPGLWFRLCKNLDLFFPVISKITSPKLSEEKTAEEVLQYPIKMFTELPQNEKTCLKKLQKSLL
jgi:hypothetical protein